jgi:hypothetical protein
LTVQFKCPFHFLVFSVSSFFHFLRFFFSFQFLCPSFFQYLRPFTSFVLSPMN